MAKLKSKPVALAGVAAFASKLVGDKLRKPKPKPKRMRKAAKVAVPGLLAVGVGGALMKLRKGGGKQSRNFSLVSGAGPAPSNSQTRPSTPPAAQPASEAKK
ncbi:MAG: hypothetical protein ACRDJO_10360 [Actinomycetota bacterium]